MTDAREQMRYALAFAQAENNIDKLWHDHVIKREIERKKQIENYEREEKERKKKGNVSAALRRLARAQEWIAVSKLRKMVRNYDPHIDDLVRLDLAEDMALAIENCERQS